MSTCCDDLLCQPAVSTCCVNLLCQPAVRVSTCCDDLLCQLARRLVQNLLIAGSICTKTSTIGFQIKKYLRLVWILVVPLLFCKRFFLLSGIPHKSELQQVVGSQKDLGHHPKPSQGYQHTGKINKTSQGSGSCLSAAPFPFSLPCVDSIICTSGPCVHTRDFGQHVDNLLQAAVYIPENAQQYRKGVMSWSVPFLWFCLLRFKQRC